MLKLKSEKIEKPDFDEVLSYIEPIIAKMIRTIAPTSPREHREEMAQEARLHAWIAYTKINEPTWKKFVQLRVKGAVIDYMRLHKGVRTKVGQNPILHSSFDQMTGDSLMEEIFQDEPRHIDYKLLEKAMMNSEEVFLTVKAALGFTREELSNISGLPVNVIDAAILRVRRDIKSHRYSPDSPVGLLVKALKPESSPELHKIDDQFDIKERIKTLLQLFQEH